MNDSENSENKENIEDNIDKASEPSTEAPRKNSQKPKTSDIAQKILKRKKDPTLQRKLQSEQLEFGNKADAEIDAALQKGKLQARASKARKRNIKYAGSFLGLLAVIYVGYLLFAPYKAGLTFGVCKVFLELNTRYPHTLRLSTVEELNDFVRIWHAKTDAFGEYRFEAIKCTFEVDEKTGGRLKSVTFRTKNGKRDVDPQKVAEFNKLLPIIFANPPDLTYPRPIPDRLQDMRIQTHLFRKPIL